MLIDSRSRAKEGEGTRPGAWARVWLAAGRAARPVRGLSRTARTISDTDLSGRVPLRSGDELADQSDFLAHVRHVLRDPITVVRGHLETLADSPHERKEAIAGIRDELDLMGRNVDDLLLLAKAPHPDFLQRGPLDLDPFTHSLFTKSRSLGSRDWRLDGIGMGSVIADQDRLTQAVMILVDHATWLTGVGEAIWLGSSLIGERVRLWVRVDGPALGPADRDPIFARYAGGRSSARRTQAGADLRLAIVQAIAEAHGGRVELDSRRGVGSTFTIVLPAEPPP